MHTLIKSCLVTLLFCLIKFSSFAQTWTGAVSSDWNVSGNWLPAGIPNRDSDVVIPGTGVTNWPFLSGNISLGLLQMERGSQLDTRGFKISVGKIVALSLSLNGALIKNTKPDTDIFIYVFSIATITNCTFEGNTEIIYEGMFLDRTRIDYAFEGSNHYKGNLKVTENGNAHFSLSFSRSVFDGDVEFIRGSFGGLTSGLYTQQSILFSGGATILGNFKYTNLAGGQLTIGSDQSNTNIAGNVEIVHSGPVIPSRNITIGGTSNFKVVGDFRAFIYFGSGFSPFVFKNLEIAKTGLEPLGISSTITIPGHLTFTSGYINSTSVPIILADGATVSGASNTSHIIGQVQKIGDDEFTFPVGDGTKLLPLTISAPSVSTDNFGVSYKQFYSYGNPYSLSSKDSSLSKVSNKGYWDLSRLSGTSNVQITLGYNEAEGNVKNPSQLRVAHWQGTRWEDLGNGGTSGSLTEGNVLSAGAVSSFSPFTLATFGSENALPVTLTDISVQNENQTALLKWSTANEINSDKFEIEHSLDAKSWRKVGVTNAAYNSKSVVNYEFIHNNPVQGMNYYRLKMIDRDATFAYSKIIDLKFTSKALLTVYPNPVAKKVYLKTEFSFGIKHVELINNLGQIITKVELYDSTKGIDVSNLSEGSYLVKVKLSNGLQETHRILLTP
ncbi:Por secretion system C-terminal sorting domain-containing protein [Dyadobacter koreensis]|uniref:Por secretion system C-terminal sorting domain-containing protein n=1 Tax=Dyadobacter koreensis TaxID=408657 RepID=A0A1H6PZK8_9BACT|nr:Por secretion system C-terminal sorting domain-containing protein [Dyadobacter koreensis]